MTAALLLAAAMSVFTDDFATNQTLAEHWQADGEIRSEEGHLVVAPGAKAIEEETKAKIKLFGSDGKA